VTIDLHQSSPISLRLRDVEWTVSLAIIVLELYSSVFHDLHFEIVLSDEVSPAVSAYVRDRRTIEEQREKGECFERMVLRETKMWV
jgi:hypothetical protein